MEQPADRSNLRRNWPWLVGLAVLSVYAAVVCVGRVTHGFIAYYAAARLLFDGQLDAHVFDDVWFTAYVQRLTGTGVLEIYGPNTPMMAWAATPVVLFPPLLARALWIAGSIAAFVGSLLWLARTARNYVPPLLIVLILLSPSVFANVRTGQAYLFVAAAYAASAVWLMRGRDVTAGVVLGLTMAIKSAGLPLLLVLALRRRWAAVVAGIVSALALALLTALYAESATWRTYAAYVPAFVQRPTIAVTANQSLVGWTRRFLEAGPLISQLFLILISLATAWRLRPAPLPTAIAGGVLVSALFSPTAEDHHFAVLAIPVLLLDQQPRRAWVLVAALLVIPLQWTAFAFTEGWSALLAYPRLYGTVLALMITVAPQRGCRFCLAPVRAACLRHAMRRRVRRRAR